MFSNKGVPPCILHFRFPARAAGLIACCYYYTIKKTGFASPPFCGGRGRCTQHKKNLHYRKDNAGFVVEVNGLEPLTLCL